MPFLLYLIIYICTWWSGTWVGLAMILVIPLFASFCLYRWGFGRVDWVTGQGGGTYQSSTTPYYRFPEHEMALLTLKFFCNLTSGWSGKTGSTSTFCNCLTTYPLDQPPLSCKKTLNSVTPSPIVKPEFNKPMSPATIVTL